MTAKQYSECKCIKDFIHFQDDEKNEFKTCQNCRDTRKRYHDKNKDSINSKRREERACNGNIKCECGLIVKPEKWDEHFNWTWHWTGLKNKIINEYNHKLLVAKKKKQKLLKEKKDRELKELLDKSGREFIL